MIEVIRNAVHRHISGRVASIYGAAPWCSERERAEWRVSYEGWTWRDTDTNTVGLCRAPVSSQKEAQDIADAINARRAAQRAAHAKAWAPVHAPIEWERSRDNEGYTVHRSGEGYSIRKLGAWYQCEDIAGTDELPAYRSLKAAREWCEMCIRSERKDRVFGSKEAIA